jgi:hypothetical protein
MTATTLTVIAGAVLSLLFSYIPGMNTWYAGLNETYKRLIMLGCLVLVTGGIFGLSCTGWWSFVTCDKVGALQVINALVLAAAANQGAFKLSPVAPAVKAVK